MATPQFLASILDWLRAGYPQGVPATDYLPVLALLRRQHLTDAEVDEVARALARAADGRPIDRVDTGVQITKVLDALPDEQDVTRVAELLARHGWPFDDSPLPG